MDDRDFDALVRWWSDGADRRRAGRALGIGALAAAAAWFNAAGAEARSPLGPATCRTHADCRAGVRDRCIAARCRGGHCSYAAFRCAAGFRCCGNRGCCPAS